MPEYLAPGVYVEEVSYRASTIEGVPTSTTGFAGLAPFGPVYFPGGPSTCEPLLVTSFPEFELAYGKLDQIFVGGQWRLPYLAHAARAFFLNGGQLLYISRVFKPTAGDTALGVASAAFAVPTPTLHRDLAGPLARQHGQRRHHHDRDPQPGRRRAHRHRAVRGHGQDRHHRRGGVPEHAARGHEPVRSREPPDRPGEPGRDADVPQGRRQHRRAERDGPALDRPAQRVGLRRLGTDRRLHPARARPERPPVRPEGPGPEPPGGPERHHLARLRLHHGRGRERDLAPAGPGRHRGPGHDGPPDRRERRPAAALLRLPGPARRPRRRHDQGDRPVCAGRGRRHRHRGDTRRGRARRPRRADRCRERAHRALRVPAVPVRDRRRSAGVLGQRHPRLPG